MDKKIYDEITLTFPEGSDEYNSMIDALNMHALKYVQESALKDINISKLENVTREVVLPNGTKIEMPTVTQQISNTNAHKSIHMLETLQKVSGGKFNFERAYDFNTKLTEAVRKNSNIAEAIKVAA